jgi:adenylate kinase
MDLNAVSDKDLFAEFTRRMYCSSKPNKKVIFIGPPGGGKGTQSPRLSEEYCWCALSTGDMLREAVSKGTELGKKAEAIMKRGDLVPDELVIGLIQNKINSPECRYGAILDGFPRTMVQAKKLDQFLEADKAKIDQVIEFNIRDELLAERITGRRVHKSSGRSYHVKYNPPKVDGVDDVTGEPIIQRDDDKEEVLKKRLEQYHLQTEPILDYYRGQNKLASLNAEQSINDIWNNLKASIN